MLSTPQIEAQGTILVQYSRGVAPVQPIVEAMCAAQRYGWAYEIVCGLPLVEAKNHAALMALQTQRHLVLIEDDILADETLWDACALLGENEVGYARARMRDGQDNVYEDEHGRFQYTGNCLCVIPFPVLARIDRPIFEARKWLSKEDRLAGPQLNGIGSDTTFWYKIRHLDPVPAIVDLGRVTHLRHPLNERRDNLTPTEIKEW